MDRCQDREECSGQGIWDGIAFSGKGRGVISGQEGCVAWSDGCLLLGSGCGIAAKTGRSLVS